MPREVQHYKENCWEEWIQPGKGKCISVVFRRVCVQLQEDQKKKRRNMNVPYATKAWKRNLVYQCDVMPSNVGMFVSWLLWLNVWIIISLIFKMISSLFFWLSFMLQLLDFFYKIILPYRYDVIKVEKARF